MSVFVHSQGIKTDNAGGGGVKKWQNSVHVVVECPLKQVQLTVTDFVIWIIFIFSRIMLKY